MLGVPLHGDDVAPRFCSADEFLIAELDRDEVRRVRRLTVPEVKWSQRLERLSAAGVSVLLCGGFNRSFLPLAEDLGIRVISGLAGEARWLIEAFVRGEIDRYRFLPRRGRHRGGRGVGRPRQGDERELRGKEGVEPCREATEPVRWEPDRARDEVAVAAAGSPTEPDL
jgi:predicted Fe-Mo cluster-binding NifX family protein